MPKRYLLPALALPLLTGLALGQTTGVSRPDQSYDDTTIAPPPQTSDHYVMPSQAAGQTAAPVQGTAPSSAYPNSYSEQSFPATGNPSPATTPAVDATAAAAQTPAPASGLIRRDTLPATAPTQAPAAACYGAVQTAYTPEPAPVLRPGTDDGMVQVQLIPHTLNEGVVLKTHLDQAFSTETTVVGTPFTAQLLTDVGHSGEVLLPAGSIVHGTVTEIHGGKRWTGPASIRLQAETVTTPDGLTYPLRATVSGIQSEEDQHVNSEGAIQPTTHPKETAIAIGSVAGAGTIMGAALGGGIGAGVGALVGAGAGTIFWLKRDHQETLPAGTTLYFSLDEPFHAGAR